MIKRIQQEQIDILEQISKKMKKGQKIQSPIITLTPLFVYHICLLFTLRIFFYQSFRPLLNTSLFIIMLQHNRQKDKMKVLVRVRPLSNKQSEQILNYQQFLQGKRNNTRNKLTPQTISFFSKYRNAHPRQVVKLDANSVSVYDQQYKNCQKKMKEYVFSDVFGEKVSNNEIFHDSIIDGINGVTEGYNCTIFAYGITGSGKTFSIFGHPKLQKDKGLCFLAYQYLLKKKYELEKNNATATFKFSFLEIYNENIRDLLSDDPKKQVTLSEDTKGNIQMMDSIQIEIKSLQQITELLSSGSARRASAATMFNQLSSRSHAVLRINVEIIKEKQKINSKLFIIDLAGSEKLNNQNSVRKTEGVNINKSLLTLGNCINALAQNSKKPGVSHIPYRDSKLTRLLKDSLGGNARIIMIACISAYPFCLQQTVTTLNYAERAKGIKKQITKNVVISPQPHCPKCNCLLSDKKPTSPQSQQSNAKIPQFADIKSYGQIQSISNELLERLYNDIIDNARQAEKLERIKTIIEAPCNEYDVVFKANQSQGQALKMALFHIFHSKSRQVKEDEDCESPRPQKKKIRLSNSSRKNSMQKIKQFNKENTAISTQKKIVSLQYPIQQAPTFNYFQSIKEISNKKQGNEENSIEKGGSTLSQKKKRSKVEIVKRPPMCDTKRSSSQRVLTQYKQNNSQ